MNEIRLQLTMNSGTNDIDVVAWIDTVGARVGRFANPFTLSESEFQVRGQTAIRELVAAFHLDPHPSAAAGELNHWIERKMFMGRPKAIGLAPASNQREAVVEILHYDNSGAALPCSFSEECFLTTLDDDPVKFAQMVSGAFERSTDFIWAEWGLWDAAAFIDAYYDAMRENYYLFDWVAIDVPPGHGGLAVTAWGYPRVLKLDEMQHSGSVLVVESLREFPLRQRRDNPNPHPRGCQVRDAGVEDQRRIVIYRRKDTARVFVRAYNFDSANRDQVDAGVEIGLDLDANHADVIKIILGAFAHCKRE